MTDSKKSNKVELAYVKLGSFQEPTFTHSLGRLVGHKFKDPRITYKVMKISESINKVMQSSQKAFITTLKEYAELDDKGEFVPKDDKPGTYVIPEEKQESWKKVYSEFGETKESLNRKKLDLDDLTGFELSAMDMTNLEGIVDISGVEG